jgi:hypothetical protein
MREFQETIRQHSSFDFQPQRDHGHSKILTALAGMNYTRKKWCSWSAFVIPMHESTKELHWQSSLLHREQSHAE